MDARWLVDRGKIYNQAENVSSTGFVSDTYAYNGTAGVFACSVQQASLGMFVQAAEGEVIEKNRTLYCKAYLQAYIHEGDIFVHTSSVTADTYLVTSVMNVLGDHLEVALRRRTDVTLTGG